MIRNVLNWSAVATLALLISACGGGEGGGSSTESGSLVDSYIQGALYKTPTNEGVTDSLGTFYYKSGEKVVFTVAGVEFPAVTGAPLITPLELAGASNLDDNAVINIARFIQSLDNDQNPDNGIVIPENLLVSGLNYADFSQTPADFETAFMDLSIGVSLVDQAQAMGHLQEQLDLYSNQGEGNSSGNSDLDAVFSAGMDLSTYGDGVYSVSKEAVSLHVDSNGNGVVEDSEFYMESERDESSLAYVDFEANSISIYSYLTYDQLDVDAVPENQNMYSVPDIVFIKQPNGSFVSKKESVDSYSGVTEYLSVEIVFNALGVASKFEITSSTFPDIVLSRGTSFIQAENYKKVASVSLDQFRADLTNYLPTLALNTLILSGSDLDGAYKYTNSTSQEVDIIPLINPINPPKGGVLADLDVCVYSTSGVMHGCIQTQINSGVVNQVGGSIVVKPGETVLLGLEGEVEAYNDDLKRQEVKASLIFASEFSDLLPSFVMYDDWDVYEFNTIQTP